MSATATFVGRSADLTSLRILLEHSRLVTALGPGGVGKSCLAHHYANQAMPLHAGGVVRVDLAEVRHSHEVVVAVAEATGHPVSRTNALHQLGLDLRERTSTLLLLDNAERCIDALAKALQVWLQEAPEIRFLVTSRRPLALAEERRLTLEPLAEADAVALFAVRASASGASVPPSETQAVRELVRRLDGIPLAIELAAGRAGAFTPSELLTRLDEQFRLLRTRRRDVAERHTTLRRTIEWSWDLLAPWERLALTQCAVFQGGFCMEAAEAIVDVDDIDAWVPDAVQSLADQALIRVGPAPGFSNETRFRVYASVRDYVTSRTDVADVLAAANRRHEAWALGRAERWAAEAERQGVSAEGLRRLALERDNILAVYRRSVADRPSVALRALLALDILMHWTGSTHMQLDRLTRVLSAAADLPSELAERARVARSLAALWCGRVAEARIELEGVLKRAHRDETAGSKNHLIARALLVLSQASYYADDLDEAANAAREALTLGEQSENISLQAQAHAKLAMALSIREPTAAHKHYLASVRLERSQGNRIGAAFGATRLAKSATEPALAIDTLGEWLDVVRDIGAAVGEGTLLGDLADSHARMGQLDTAADLARQAVEASDRAGNRPALVRHLGRLGWIQQARGNQGEAREAYRRARRGAVAEGIPVQEALVLANEGSLLHETGQVEAALESYAAANAAIATRDLPWLQGVIALRRAMALAEQGSIENAKTALKEAQTRLAETEEHRAVQVAEIWITLVNTTDRASAKTARAQADAIRDAHHQRRQWAFRTDAESLDEVGLAHRLLACAQSRVDMQREEGAAALCIAKDGSSFSYQGGTIDLTRRKAMRLILKTLAEQRVASPGEVIPLFDLVEAGWPGERTLPEAGANRVYSAVRDLRKLGLRQVLVRADDGYRLDPKVSFAWEDT